MLSWDGVVRLGLVRPVWLEVRTPPDRPLTYSVGTVMEHLPIPDGRDGKPVTWTRREAARLAFLCWRRDFMGMMD